MRTYKSNTVVPGAEILHLVKSKDYKVLVIFKTKAKINLGLDAENDVFKHVSLQSLQDMDSENYLNPVSSFRCSVDDNLSLITLTEM